MPVNKTLSRGMADRILAEYADIQRPFIQGMRKASMGTPTKRADVGQQASQMVAHAEALSLSTVAANHPRWRWATVAAIFPFAQQNAFSPGNRIVAYYLFPFQLSIGKPCCLPSEPRVILEVMEHALERLFLRLNSTDLEVVKDEIHEALCLATHLHAASECLGLKQVVLPTKTGAFLGEHSKERPIIRANTWISYSDLTSKQEKLAVALSRAWGEIGGSLLLGEAIGSLPYGATLGKMEPLPSLLDVLRQATWLTQEYERGVDIQGEAWNKAKQQAQLEG